MTFVAVKGTARIRHYGKGEVFEIDADELDFEAVGADDRNMGPEIHHQADVEHPELGRLVWSLWEYPIGMENMQETDVGDHELLENVDFGIEHEPDDDEPDDEPPDLEQLLSLLPGRLTALEAALDRLSEPSALIGHNAPPAEFRLRLEDGDIAKIRESVLAVRDELAKPDAASLADPAVLGTARDRIAGFGSTLGGWGKWAGVAVGAGVLGGLGKGIGEQIWTETPSLDLLVHAILQTLTVWLHALTSAL